MTYEGVLKKRAQGLQPDSRWAYSYRRNCNEGMQQLQSLFRWFGTSDLPLANRELLLGAQRASRSADWNSDTRHRDEAPPLQSP